MNQPGRIVRLVAGLFLLVLTPWAQALETITKLVPVEGPWVAPNVPNTAWFFEVDEQDYGFVAWYTYEPDGSATFLTLQGTLTYTSELERRDSGVIARLSSPIFTARNGACPTCEPRPADIAPSDLGNGEFVWTSARRGSIRYAGRTVALQAFELTWPEMRQLEGTWRLDSRDIDLTAANPHFRARYGSAVVRIFRSAGAIPLHTHAAENSSLPAGDRQAYDFGTFPSPQAAFYTVECITGCTGADLYATNGPESTATKPGRWVFWYEGGIFRMANIYSVSAPFPNANQVNGGSLVGEVFVTQNQVTIRRRSPRVDTFRLHSADVVLSRLPDNWTRP